MKPMLFLLLTMAIALNVAAQSAPDLYKAKCAVCHSADATGKSAMQNSDLHRPEVQKLSEAQLQAATATGKGKMPAFKDKLSSDQIAGLIVYLRTLIGPAGEGQKQASANPAALKPDESKPVSTPTPIAGTPPAPATTPAASASASPAPAGTKAAPGKPALIDLNSATKEELMTLSGIGDAYADKIIAGRPYKTKTDLLRRKILPNSIYANITKKVVARQPQKKK